VNEVKPGGTVAPILISTDKTKLIHFIGGKVAYPVYLNVGNIPKQIQQKPSQHACILITYLSVDKIDRSAMGMSDQEHHIQVQRVFHEVICIVLESLIKAGKKGMEMVSSDGSIRDISPLISCYAADYLERCHLLNCCNLQMKRRE